MRCDDYNKKLFYPIRLVSEEFVSNKFASDESVSYELVSEERAFEVYNREKKKPAVVAGGVPPEMAIKYPNLMRTILQDNMRPADFMKGLFYCGVYGHFWRSAATRLAWQHYDIAYFIIENNFTFFDLLTSRQQQKTVANHSSLKTYFECLNSAVFALQCYHASYSTFKAIPRPFIARLCKKNQMLCRQLLDNKDDVFFNEASGDVSDEWKSIFFTLAEKERGVNVEVINNNVYLVFKIFQHGKLWAAFSIEDKVRLAMYNSAFCNMLWKSNQLNGLKLAQVVDLAIAHSQFAVALYSSDQITQWDYRDYERLFCQSMLNTCVEKKLFSYSIDQIIHLAFMIMKGRYYEKFSIAAVTLFKGFLKSVNGEILESYCKKHNINAQKLKAILDEAYAIDFSRFYFWIAAIAGYCMADYGGQFFDVKNMALGKSGNDGQPANAFDNNYDSQQAEALASILIRDERFITGCSYNGNHNVVTACLNTETRIELGERYPRLALLMLQNKKYQGSRCFTFEESLKLVNSHSNLSRSKPLIQYYHACIKYRDSANKNSSTLASLYEAWQSIMGSGDADVERLPINKVPRLSTIATQATLKYFSPVSNQKGHFFKHELSTDDQKTSRKACEEQVEEARCYQAYKDTMSSHFSNS